MRALLSLVILCFLSMQPALAAQQAPSPQEVQFGEWMSYYYLQKDTSKVSGFLKFLQDGRMLEKHDGAAQPTAAFLAVIFSDNPAQVQAWVKNTGFTGKTKEATEYALWLSGNGKMIADVFKDTPEYAKSTPVGLSNLTLKQPGDLDMMWGAFSASGSELYVKKIIDVLDDSKPLTGDKTADMMTRGSAEWSLGSNMMQHELVNRAIRKEINARSGVVKKKLEEIVARNEKNAKPFPNKDGDFSAMMVLTDEKALSEYAKPSNEGLHFKEMTTAKHGDSVVIKIVFAGMELTNDLRADVTFDLKTLGPDGKIYDNTDLRNVEALKMKVPMRFRIFDNSTVEGIRFDPQDKLGKYKIIAEIRDNVGKKKLLLTKEIELTQ